MAQDTQKQMEKMARTMKRLQENQAKTQKGVDRIQRLLEGDEEMGDEGFASMIRYSHNYARKNTESRLIERAEPALSLYERWTKDGKWTLLNDMMGKYRAAKLLVAMIFASGILSASQLVAFIVNKFGK